MPEPLLENEPEKAEAPILNDGRRLTLEAGVLAGRLAAFLAEALPSEQQGPVAEGIAFLEAAFQAVADGRPLSDWQGGPLQRSPQGAPQALDRLAAGLDLCPHEVDLTLLAGLAEEHEGFADILRSLNPNNAPYPALGLATQFLGLHPGGRRHMRQLLETGAAVAAGVLKVQGDGPFFNRNLLLAERLWSAMQGIDAWPGEIEPLGEPAAMHGLEDWLAGEEARRALDALEASMACTVLVSAESERTAFERAAALVQASGCCSVRIQLPAEPSPEVEKLIQVHALARGVVPVLCLKHGDGPGLALAPSFSDFPYPVVLCSRAGAADIRSSRPLIGVSCDRLSPSSLRRMWAATLPRLADEAPLLAARYPLEPAAARRVAADMAHLEAVGRRESGLAEVGASVRARSGSALGGGVKLLHPRAGWEHLVLPPGRLRQLEEAVDRLVLQAKVLDEWRFLKGRHGARGVRLLFAGPPGTGKTLAAEVMARALETDLLVVDLSRVVSKWIGETEKNLAEVFETAERARSALLFDEADALFGKRTEVSDAHDRYANLETAYLLTRLERFEGLAMLSTNLRQNIDSAFTRRLEFVVPFREPNRAERLALWRCHLPDSAPLADEVDLRGLADFYPMVGGLIRNAAVAAAFLAAGEGSEIGNRHFIQAIRREYDKAGKAFPGLPPEFAGLS